MDENNITLVAPAKDKPNQTGNLYEAQMISSLAILWIFSLEGLARPARPARLARPARPGITNPNQL
jgi:hypothetical protein